MNFYFKQQLCPNDDENEELFQKLGNYVASKDTFFGQIQNLIKNTNCVAILLLILHQISLIYHEWAIKCKNNVN